jgi:murein DD-endopeptidase MepM/ murein hydrolase activator NlpD
MAASLETVGRLDRWTWAGAAVALFCVLGARPSAALPSVRVVSASVEAAGAGGPSDLAEEGCPPGTAPDNDACVHLTGGAEDGPLAPSRPNIHREKSGRLREYEQIPRLPDRPSDYDAYRYPIPPGLPGGRYVVSGYDLDRPDDQQRRGRTLRHVGHGGVDLPQAKGTPVKMVALEHQEGDAEVLYTGPLFGTTVVTRHTLREGGRLLDYVVLFGHLDAVAQGVSAGTSLKDGDLVGAVGDTGSPSLVHLHLEVRRVREGVDLAKTPAGPMLANDAVTVVCDPRNVLPLK